MCRLFGIIKKRKINNLEKLLLFKNIVNSYLKNNKDGFAIYCGNSNNKSFRTLDFKEFLKKFNNTNNNKKIIIHLRYSTNITNEKATHFAVITQDSNITVTIGHNGVFYNYLEIEEILSDLKKKRKKDKKLKKLMKAIEKEATLKNDTYLFLLLLLYHLKTKSYNNLTVKDIREAIKEINKRYKLGNGVVYLEINNNVFLISINKEMYLTEYREGVYFNSNNDVNETLETNEITISEEKLKTKKEIKDYFKPFTFKKERIVKEKITFNKELLNNIKINDLETYNNCIIKIENAKIKEIEKLDFLEKEFYPSIYEIEKNYEEDLKEELGSSYIPTKYRIKDIIEEM